MKQQFIAALLPFGVSQVASAFDTGKASTDRFKVTYVEPAVVPPITALPDFYLERKAAIEADRTALKNGTSKEDLLLTRKLHFQYALYPIRITDKKTGFTYELQSDRRTIIAKKPNGDLIWKINPYKDAKLGPYRVKHPFIHYFGRSANYSKLKGPVLAIAFTSSQFGDIDLESGKFHWQGQD
ncbi:hypothetical protein JIN84_20865 [Luteolibacter yonseiensis]|uniref:Uncharacterized protein n=1 Tax=Luteolibacter yonseiensis TaxID=1144680 RepID=A0A934R869_9BACT|nr:hypothetical protein [Luteolibacter yonseiensis]MBK1818087.1 hypothetical protein [Luteolibacter yonseiensis]